jgi:hypothetical protein
MDKNKTALLTERVAAAFPFVIILPQALSPSPDPDRYALTLLNVPSARIAEVKRETWKLVDEIFGQDERLFSVYTVNPENSLKHYASLVSTPLFFSIAPSSPSPLVNYRGLPPEEVPVVTPSESPVSLGNGMDLLPKHEKISFDVAAYFLGPLPEGEGSAA